MVKDSSPSQADRLRLQRAGANYSLICAVLGLLIAALMTTVLLGLLAGSGLHEILIDPYFRAPIAVAVISLGAAAWVLGRLAGDLVYRFSLAGPATPIIGVLLALTCLIISVSAGYVTHFLSSIHQPEMLLDYVIWPAVAVMGFGFVPALILGLAFSSMICSEINGT